MAFRLQRTALNAFTNRHGELPTIWDMVTAERAGTLDAWIDAEIHRFASTL